MTEEGGVKRGGEVSAVAGERGRKPCRVVKGGKPVAEWVEELKANSSSGRNRSQLV